MLRKGGKGIKNGAIALLTILKEKNGAHASEIMPEFKKIPLSKPMLTVVYNWLLEQLKVSPYRDIFELKQQKRGYYELVYKKPKVAIVTVKNIPLKTSVEMIKNFLEIDGIRGIGQIMAEKHEKIRIVMYGMEQTHNNLVFIIRGNDVKDNMDQFMYHLVKFTADLQSCMRNNLNCNSTTVETIFCIPDATYAII